MVSTALRESTGMLLVDLARAHRSRVAQGLSTLGLHIGQELLLAQLWDTDGLSQKELAERLAVEPPTIAKMVTRMEKAGWVTRRRDPSDARSRLVAVTPQGAKLQRRIERLWTDLDRQLVRRLTKEEIHGLRALLARMTRNLS